MTKKKTEKECTVFNIGDIETHGECRGWSCLICDDIVDKMGDLNNPIVNICGEKMCNDCKTKIRKLIGK